jgi:DNA-binding CsgD family transcriptional regulator
MAVVYRAIDEHLGRVVTIKLLVQNRILSEDTSARFLREARAAARLSHPHIAALYDADHDGPWHFLVLEHMPGGDLRTLLIKRGQPLTVDEALDYVRGILSGLACAHSNGVIHGDLKPENVLIAADGLVKLTDFGFALIREELRLTHDGLVLGPPHYLSPEALRGESVDARADLYAVGVILYELLAGHPPFDGDTMSAIASQILKQEPPPLSSGLINLENVLVCLLAKDPKHRFQTAEETLDALPKYEQAVSVGLAPPAILDLRFYAAQEDKTTALETERRRLANLLRQEVISALDLLLAQTGAYEQGMGANPQARMALSVLGRLIRQTTQQVRDLEAALSPTILEEMGLEPALQALVEQVRRGHTLDVRLVTGRLVERLPAAVELALFRAAQDILDRAASSAQASQALLCLQRDGDQVVLKSEDNGPVTTVGDKLQTLRERLQGLGAKVQTTIGELGGLSFTVIVRLRAPVDLTLRELDVLRLVAEGLSNKQIAHRLGISPRTVNFHLDNLYVKLGVNSRTEAAITALREGWIRLTPV